MTDIVERDLERRRGCPDWNPWQNIQPFDAYVTALDFIEELYESECWDEDAADMTRMALKLEGWLHTIYNHGRWAQGCIEQDRENANAKD